MPSYVDTDTRQEIRALPSIYSKTASRLEFTSDRWIEIPEEVLKEYVHSGRPTPLIRARKLEETLKTPARIYYKCEDLYPIGTFKMNTAIAQAYWAAKEGFRRTIFSGGSGTRTKFAHVFAARAYGLKPTIFMSRKDCEEHTPQVFMLRKMLGADLKESPSSLAKYEHGSVRGDMGRIVEQEMHEEVMKAKRRSSSYFVHS